MPKGKLRVATCQFAVGANIRRNAAQIKKQIVLAKNGGCDGKFGGALVKDKRSRDRCSL